MGSHLERALEKKGAVHKESVAKWTKDNPGRQPGHSLKTWKTYSRQRLTSDAYRKQFDSIDWSV